MSNWISITKETLYQDKVAALIDACDGSALADGQTGRAAAIIQGVVDDIRMKVASCRNNVLDADETTIPRGLRNLAVDMTIARLKKAIDEPLSQDERDELARHERRLTRIADCAEVVDIPDTTAESPSSQSTAGRPRITPRVPRFDRTSQDGI